MVIAWQVQEKYFLIHNEFQKNFSIERTFKSQLLIKTFHVFSNSPQEIFIPKDIELSAKEYKIDTIKEFDEENFVE